MPKVEIIETSIDADIAEVNPTVFSGLEFVFRKGWSSTKLPERDVLEVREIDADAYRSAGGAAAWAIAGGVLTGGLGLLVGAAVGGRRRQVASYLVRFKDGQHLAFTTKAKAVIRALAPHIRRAAVAAELHKGQG